MSEHVTKIYITFGEAVLEYQAKCRCGWSSEIFDDPGFARRSASQHRRHADARVLAVENLASGKPAKAPKPVKPARPAPNSDARFLKRLTSEQQARYRELLTGRTNVSGTGPMVINDIVRREALDTVLLETKLGGQCCESCIAKQHAKNQQHAVLEPLPSLRELVTRPWEGRKLSADELRERMRALRARGLPNSDRCSSESKLRGVAIEQEPGKVRFYPYEAASCPSERLEVNPDVL